MSIDSFTDVKVVTEPMKHTREPWHAKGHHIIAETVTRDRDQSTHSYLDEVTYYGGFLVAESMNEPNAKRAALCVNACIGLSNEVLEKMSGDGGVSAELRLKSMKHEESYRKFLNEQLNERNADIEELRKENRALIAELLELRGPTETKGG